jgi:hypothetical protein
LYPETCAYLLLTTKHHQSLATTGPGHHILYETSIPKAYVMFFLPLEIDRNVAAEDVRKWNILGAIQGSSMVWKSIMLTVIQNYYVQCCFGTAFYSSPVIMKTMNGSRPY